MSVTGSCHFGIRIHSVPNIQWILFARIVSRFWEFWAIDTHLKSRLQLNHVPVHKTHKTHSAKVIKMIWQSAKDHITTSRLYDLRLHDIHDFTTFNRSRNRIYSAKLSF